MSGGAEAIECTTTTNSVIIIGANGSGKSRLGAWMEVNYIQDIYRIGAQRNLSFGTFIKQKSYEESMNYLQTGTASNTHSRLNRWGHTTDGLKIHTKYTTGMLNDFEHVLSATIAKRNNENNTFVEQCKEEDKVGKTPRSTAPERITDKIVSIWTQILPHRGIKFDDSKVTATLHDLEYDGREMSDGERVALYFIAQALCVPEGKTIIIDEPESHLHSSIINRLWLEIEKERQDCLFIYITHDTQFAANHRHSDKIWVKEYDGSVWEWEKIPQTGFPEQLLLDVLGNRKPVIFVEGNSDSYDTKLYSAIYKNYYIVPCGSCSEVILRTKAFRRLQAEQLQLHHVEVFGIIDRDFRVDEEIAALKENKIFTLTVAEVENLFIVEEILSIVNNHQKFEDVTRVDQVKKYIIDERFCNQVNTQIFEATVAEIKHRLSTIDISKEESEAETSFDSALGGIDFNTIRDECKTRFHEASTNKNYNKILSLFNCKGLSQSVGKYFGISNKDYCDLILRLINTDKAVEIIAAMQNYLPNASNIPIVEQEGEP